MTSQLKMRIFEICSYVLISLTGIIAFTGCDDDDDDTIFDSGTTPEDAGTTPSDAGTTPDDAGTTPGDASTGPWAPERPIVFVHGGSGSAHQFESNAQRFMINGYPLEYLAVYEHATGTEAPQPADQLDGLDAVIDAVLAKTGKTQVDLLGHSRGTIVSTLYLRSSEARAAKVAHYVAFDGTGDVPDTTSSLGAAVVPTLCLWGDMAQYVEGDPTKSIEGAEHIMDTTQTHIEMCTSAASFARLFKFITGKDPETTEITPESGTEVTIQGRAVYFPQNEVAPGTLEIYEVDSSTGFRIGTAPVYTTTTTGTDGSWGPYVVKRGGTYEFAFQHEAGEKHYFYREAFNRSDYFVRLLTSKPGSGIGFLLTKSDNHTDILISRDKEFWGDQETQNDVLIVDGQSVAIPPAAARAHRLSGLFLMDWGADKTVFPTTPDQATDLSTPIKILHDQIFLSGLDLYMPGAATPDRTIECSLTPRGGGGKKQIVNVPNWASTQARITVNFRDFAQ